jgi:hypothetical protein
VSGEFESIKLSPDAVAHRGMGRTSTPLYMVIYKFPDADGKWVYSQYLPSSAIPEDNIERLASFAPYSSAGEEEAAEDGPLQATGDEPAPELTPEQLARAAESERIKQENCNKARDRLEKAKDPRYDLLKTADGLLQTVSEEMRSEMIETAAQNIETFCE